MRDNSIIYYYFGNIEKLLGNFSPLPLSISKFTYVLLEQQKLIKHREISYLFEKIKIFLSYITQSRDEVPSLTLTLTASFGYCQV